MSHFTEKEEQFLTELEELSRKYKIQIWGCGCCGSPSLRELEDNELSQGSGYGHGGSYSDIEWIPEDGFEWKLGRRPVKRPLN